MPKYISTWWTRQGKPWIRYLAALSLTACMAARPECTLDPVELGWSPSWGLVELQADLPVRRPVTVQEAHLLRYGWLGLSIFRGDHYEVYLETTLDDQGKWDVLIHEWAHLLVWEAGVVEEDQHGPAWAEAYGRAFRAAVE